MTRDTWLCVVCLAYILSGIKGFPQDNWSILSVWLGFGGLCALNYAKRQEKQNDHHGRRPDKSS